MAFQKYNGANNAIAFLDAPITNVSNTLTLNGGYDRFPTTNFIVSVVQYDINNDVEFRENMLISTRSGNICNVQTRKFELVPENEASQGSVQESYAFEIGSTVELTVSNAFIEDIQDEVTDLGSRVTTNEEDITTLQADKADKSNVLELDNTDPYTPTADYHPATKKYTDEKGSAVLTKLNYTAGEDLTTKYVYRRGVSGLGETETSYYLAKADNTSKLDFEGIVVSGVTSGNTFDGIYEGIVGGYDFTFGDYINGYPYNLSEELDGSGTLFSSGAGGSTTIQTASTITVDREIKVTSFEFQGDNSGAEFDVVFQSVGGTIYSTQSITTVNGWNVVAFSPNIVIPVGDYELVITKTGGSAVFVYNNRYRLNSFETKQLEVFDPVYLQDDGSIGINIGTNEAIVGNIISTSEIRILRNISGKTDNTATNGVITLGSAEGYVTINIPGVGNKKIPYYGL